MCVCAEVLRRLKNFGAEATIEGCVEAETYYEGWHEDVEAVMESGMVARL